jgi:hypothetical protein
MAYEALSQRGFTHMCCGHQHQHICCRKTMDGIVEQELDFSPLDMEHDDRIIHLEVARIPLDCPTLLRVGGCHGDVPEFAYTDFSTFSFIRILPGS